MAFKYIVLLFLLLIILFFLWRVIYRLLVFVFAKHTSAIYVSSFAPHLRLIKNHLYLTPWKRLLDLWCGDGKAMRFFAGHFGLHCDGYEVQNLPYLYGKLCNSLLWYSQLKIYKQNFFQADLSSYDYIYLYLSPYQMAEIEPRIFKNISLDAILISNSFQFVVHQPYEVITNAKKKASIFLYKRD